MMGLSERLAAVLAGQVSVDCEDDGALTVRHGGTLASLRVVTITEGLELVSLTQILAWELPVTGKLRDAVAEQARHSQLGSVALMEGGGAGAASKTADVMLRYNFPGAGLSDDALATLVLLVLDTGVEIGRALTG